jgi:hypothetical protein
MLTIDLLTAPDMTLSWISYSLLSLPLATIIAGALTIRGMQSQKGSNAQRAARKGGGRREGWGPNGSL